MFKTAIILSAFAFIAVNCSISNIIQRCNKNDPNLGECIAKTIHNLVPNLRNGIEELDIPKLDPLQVDDFTVETKKFSAEIDLTNVSIWDAMNFRIIKVVPNVAQNLFNFKLTVPRIHVEGDYGINADIVFLYLNGSGRFTLDVKNVILECSLKGDRIKENHQTHLIFKKTECDIVSFTKASIDFQNLFEGDTELEQIINSIINKNIKLFFPEIKPNLNDRLSRLFNNLANKITTKYDYNKLFL